MTAKVADASMPMAMMTMVVDFGAARRLNWLQAGPPP
jgi:hypothetical protein